MLPPARRQAGLLFAAFLLLAVIFWTWLIPYFPWYIDIDPPELRNPPPPESIVSRAGLEAATCDRALRVVSDAVPSDLQAGRLILEEAAAERVASRILAEYFRLPVGQIPAFYGGPELLQATSDEGRSIWVWAVVWIPYRSGGSVFTGNAAVLHLSADSPHVATLFTEVSVIDPASTCRDGTSLRPFYPGQQTPLWVMLLSCALPVVGIAALVGWVRAQVRV
jgi:hypothetical protein